jgi:hypothetical protein
LPVSKFTLSEIADPAGALLAARRQALPGFHVPAKVVRLSPEGDL